MRTKPALILTAAVVFAAFPAWIQAAEAQEHWTKQCAKCHGPDGVGATPMGKKLKLKDLTDPAVHAALTDEAIAGSIVDGVRDDAGKLVMPAFAEKIPAKDVPALVAFVRALNRGQ